MFPLFRSWLVVSLEGYSNWHDTDILVILLKAEVKQINGKLQVQFLPTSIFYATLEHWHYDTFTIEMTAMPSLKKGKCSFVIDSQGEVEEMRIDIPNPDFDFTELEFKKIQ